MGILSRFTTIMKSNINALLDAAENPEKMVDQMLLDLNKDLAQVKKETAGVMGHAKAADRDVSEIEAQVKRFNDLAEKALIAGNESDAMVFLGKKQEEEGKLAEAKKIQAAAHDNANKMRGMYDKLAADISALEGRKRHIKAKAQIARTQKKVAAATSRARGDTSGFDRLENKVNKQFDEAAALMELSEETGCEAEDLAEKYASGKNSTSVTNELEAMKARLGLNNNN